MAEKQRLSLSFSMTSAFQRQVWEQLSAVPAGQRTDAVCRAVSRMYGQESLLEAIRTVVREELHGVELIPAKKEPEQPPEAGDVGDDVLGFLFALQNDGGEETSDSIF